MERSSTVGSRGRSRLRLTTENYPQHLRLTTNYGQLLFLALGEQWQFVMPNYSGPMKTSLRLELAYRSTVEGTEENVLYSAPFPGSVHPKQFKMKLKYHPGGIMDPYWD